MIQNTTHSNLAIAESYYHHMLQKDFEKMASCLHDEVQLISPLAEIFGKASVVSSAQNLMQILMDIKIRSKFSSGDSIMFAYDFLFPDPIGKLRSAVLMEFQNHLISKIELFYDGRPFEEKKDTIFGK